MARSQSGWVLFVAAVALAAGGCSAHGAQTAVAEPSSPEAAPTQQAAASPPQLEGDGERYAAALREAFEAYEAQVEAALELTYRSEAEAQAVAMTLGTKRFEMLLKGALQSRGLNVQGLASYAEAHPDFFHEQQRNYWGRLEQLRSALRSLDERVEPAGRDRFAARH